MTILSFHILLVFAVVPQEGEELTIGMETEVVIATIDEMIIAGTITAETITVGTITAVVETMGEEVHRHTTDDVHQAHTEIVLHIAVRTDPAEILTNVYPVDLFHLCALDFSGRY